MEEPGLVCLTGPGKHKPSIPEIQTHRVQSLLSHWQKSRGNLAVYRTLGKTTLRSMRKEQQN